MAATEERLVRIESLLAHLQHDIETLSGTLTDHFQQLQKVNQRFASLERQLELLTQPENLCDPNAEKPPHY